VIARLQRHPRLRLAPAGDDGLERHQTAADRLERQLVQLAQCARVLTRERAKLRHRCLLRDLDAQREQPAVLVGETGDQR
jgi:hypothetical protein